MKIIQTDDFDRKLEQLPNDIQTLYQKQVQNFLENWRDPRLHVKKVRELPHAFSFRITRRYRVFFFFHDITTAIFFTIDHRKDAYRDL